MPLRSPPSPTKMAAERRQLVRPSPHMPWSADVVSAVPREVVESLSLAASGAATSASWSCVALEDPPGTILAWQSVITQLTQSIESPQNYVKLYFPDLVPTSRNRSTIIEPLPPLLALANGDKESVQLYAAEPASGLVLLRKLLARDLQASSKSRTGLLRPQGTTKVRIPLEAGEYLTVLEAKHKMIVVGTSLGNLYWLVYTHVPIGLHVVKITASSGLLARFLSRSDTDTSPVAAILPLSNDPSDSGATNVDHHHEFLSLSQLGNVIHWKVTRTVAASHQANFDANVLGNIASAKPTTKMSYHLPYPTVLKVALAADEDSFTCIVKTQDQNDSTLQWLNVHFSTDQLVLNQVKWLNRFADPTTVEIDGLVGCDNGSTYAALTHSGSVIVMVLLQDQSVLHEVDLPMTQIPSLVPNMVIKDTMTHGCLCLSTTGIGVRVRFLPPALDAEEEDEPSAKKQRRQASNPAIVQTLISHLRSVFWQYYQNQGDEFQLPPSLTKAAPENLQEAIVAFAMELQYKGDASSARNPLEWHQALIKMLQKGSLYRSLPYRARWQLLGIGQELAVFCALPRSSQNAIEQDYLSRLQPHNIADWLMELQEKELQSGSASIFPHWLSTTLDAAANFRDEFANPFYDVVEDSKPLEQLWTSQESLQRVLRRQLDYWKRDSSSVELPHVESVVKTTLTSFSESYDKIGLYDDDSKQLYSTIKKTAIDLLRSVSKDDDELAFDLSVKFNYFEGLCEMSVDHEKKEDSKFYSLDPLFATLDGTDTLSGYTFPQYVLRWHTDRGLYGHAINYGQHSPVDLDVLMKTDERLRPFQWIPAVRQGYFSKATEACMTNSKLPESTLSSSLWALSLAKLANKLEPTRNDSVLHRQAIIENRRNLLQAQKELCQGQEDLSNDNAQLLPADKLIEIAIDNLQSATTKEDRFQLCYIALSICAAMEEGSADNAAYVWSQALQLDWKLFSGWIKTQQDLTSPHLKEEVLEETIFGALVTECYNEQKLREVTFGRHIENLVMDKLGENEVRKEMLRLLHTVTASSESMSGRSLVVASY
jgi:hypothetical protein